MFYETKNGALLSKAPPLIKEAGARVVLYDPDDTIFSLSFRLEFPCSDNEVELEAPIIGLVFREFENFKCREIQTRHSTNQQRVCLERDLSRLLADCHSELIKSFSIIQFKHVPRSNK